MNTQVIRCKQYNSTYKHIVMVDGKPLCITDSDNRASEIISYLNGYDVKISDGKIKRELDKLLKKK